MVNTGGQAASATRPRAGKVIGPRIAPPNVKRWLGRGDLDTLARDFVAREQAIHRCR